VREPALRDGRAVAAEATCKLKRGFHRLEGTDLDPVGRSAGLGRPRRGGRLANRGWLRLRGGSGTIGWRDLARKHGPMKLLARVRRARAPAGGAARLPRAAGATPGRAAH